MLAIILNILKIIGIILLCLLALCLFLLLAVLFVPVRYRAEGEYQNGYWVKGRMTWLLHVISLTVKASSEESVTVVLRLFGIPIIRLPKPKHSAAQDALKPGLEKAIQKSEKVLGQTEITGAEEAKRIEELKSTVESKNIEEGMHTDQSEDTEDGKRTETLSNAESQEADEESDGQESFREETKDFEAVDAGEESQEELTFFEKIKVLIAKIVSYFRNIGYTIQKIYDNIVDIKRNIKFYIAILQSEETKAVLGLSKKQLLKIWHNIRPKKFRVLVHFGMADSPDTVGQILAIWGMLYPIHQGNIEVEADFEQTILEGSFLMKGYTSVYVYMWTLYLVLFDKNIKKLRKSFNREEK